MSLDKCLPVEGAGMAIDSVVDFVLFRLGVVLLFFGCLSLLLE